MLSHENAIAQSYQLRAVAPFGRKKFLAQLPLFHSKNRLTFIELRSESRLNEFLVTSQRPCALLKLACLQQRRVHYAPEVFNGGLLEGCCRVSDRGPHARPTSSNPTGS